MNCSTPGFPVHHPLEFSQSHVLCVSDTIQPFYPLLPPSPPERDLSQHQGLFQWVRSSHQVTRVLELLLQIVGTLVFQSSLWPESFFTQFQSTALSLDAISTLGCVSCFVMFGFSYLRNGDETREHRQSTLYSAWQRAVHHEGWQSFLWIQISMPGELTSQW